ncbi:MAG: YraN family protein [Pyrinomonadaceae bacterium]|nr:YraN family protein [Pyrinomonadaceae bacterium]
MSEILSIIDKNDRPETSARTQLGALGEQIAARALVDNGYRLVLRNFKVPVGRNSKGVQVTGEIDIIALDGETLCFVEVKTRRSDEFAPVIAAVDIRKQRQITRTARMYRRIFELDEQKYRFDVVTVLLAKHAEPVVEIVRSFWDESKFRKRRWNYVSWQGHI